MRNFLMCFNVFVTLTSAGSAFAMQPPTGDTSDVQATIREYPSNPIISISEGAEVQEGAEVALSPRSPVAGPVTSSSGGREGPDFFSPSHGNDRSDSSDHGVRKQPEGSSSDADRSFASTEASQAVVKVKSYLTSLRKVAGLLVVSGGVAAVAIIYRLFTLGSSSESEDAKKSA